MTNYHIVGLPGLFTYLEIVQRVQNGRTPRPVGVAAAANTLDGTEMVRRENDPTGSEVRLDAHPDFGAVFPRAVRAPATPIAPTPTPSTFGNWSWSKALGAAALLFVTLFVIFPLLWAAVGAFGGWRLNSFPGSIAQAQAQATKAQADADAAKKEADAAKLQAADAKKAADDAKAAAALADAKAKGASAEARTVSQINLCPGGSKANCIALLKADGLSDLGAEEGCAPTCVAP